MGAARAALARLAVPAALLALGGAGAAGVALALPRDDGVVNQTRVEDPVGDAGSAADLSALTVTSYADGTIGFVVTFANRDLLHVGETAQVFVDLDDDGNEDLNLSLWPTGEPSYLDRWNGSDWVDVRQLPELAQTNGAFSIRLPLNELRDAAGVPYGTRIGVSVATWTVDPATDKLGDHADDVLPDGNAWAQHRLTATPPPPTTTQGETTPTPTPAPAPHPALAVVCRLHVLHATVKPGRGQHVSSVAFLADGRLRSRDTRAPYAAAIPARGLRAPVTITAVVRSDAGVQTLRRRAPRCA